MCIGNKWLHFEHRYRFRLTLRNNLTSRRRRRWNYKLFRQIDFFCCCCPDPPTTLLCTGAWCIATEINAWKSYFTNAMFWGLNWLTAKITIPSPVINLNLLGQKGKKTLSFSSAASVLVVRFFGENFCFKRTEGLTINAGGSYAVRLSGISTPCPCKIGLAISYWYFETKKQIKIRNKMGKFS